MPSIAGRMHLENQSSQNRYFVTAVGTDSGKTLVSALLCKKLAAAYWKPIQCGLPADSDQIRQWLGEPQTIFPERYQLSIPASPHYAAEKEGLTIEISNFGLPITHQNLIVEGAGGLLVPVSKEATIADLILHLGLRAILVVNHYLGSINHTLLTLSELKRKNIDLAGIVFNGTDFQDAESIILAKAQAPCILRLPHLDRINDEALNFWSNQVHLP